MKIVSSSTVDYLDHMGSDLTVVNAARVSFDKAHTTFDTDKDAKLIRYLAKHNHWSPFAHPQLSFRVEAPIFVARQLAKHQVGLAWNEVSRRYVDSEPAFFIPRELRGKPTDGAKQGSSPVVIIEELDANHYPTQDPDAKKLFSPDIYLKYNAVACVSLYNWLLRSGVCPEQARMVLPQSMMTQWHWTGSLYAFSRVYKLRTDSHAQIECQDVAHQIGALCSTYFPHSWEALTGTNTGDTLD